MLNAALKQLDWLFDVSMKKSSARGSSYPLGTLGAAPLRRLLLVDRGSIRHRIHRILLRRAEVMRQPNKRGTFALKESGSLPRRETMGPCQRAARRRKRERCQRRALCRQ